MAEEQRVKRVTENGCGFKLKMKWVVVNAAPITGSGLNEILFGGPTALLTKKMATDMGYKVTDTGPYQLVKLADIYTGDNV